MNRTAVAVALIGLFCLAGCGDPNHQLHDRMSRYGMPDYVVEKSKEKTREYRPLAAPQEEWGKLDQTFYYLPHREKVEFDHEGIIVRSKMTDEETTEITRQVKNHPATTPPHDPWTSRAP